MYRYGSAILAVLALALLAGCASSVVAQPPVPTSSAAAPEILSPAAPSPTPIAAPATLPPASSSTVAASPTNAPTAAATSAATVAPTSAPTSAPTGAAAVPGTQGEAAAHVIVDMKDYAFVPKTLTVAPGTTVTWRNDDNTTHTATADDKLFDSGNMGPGAEFSYTFSKPGVYPYYCIWHGAPGGQGMAGTITVK